MAASLQLNSSSPFAGLGTAQLTVPSAGLYTVAVESFIPYQASGSSASSSSTAGQSGLQIQIQKNAVAQLTTGGAANNPTPTQATLGAKVSLQCAANDVLAVVFSSANAVDAVPNAVKSIINVFQGS